VLNTISITLNKKSYLATINYMEERKIFVGKSLRVFVSYSIDDRFLAHGVKVGLGDFGIDVFLAHDDIPGGAEWEETIVKNIKQTDVFIQLLTKNYRKSEWTDQETGIALSGQKMIIPLKVDINPYGFTKKYQAFRLVYKEIKHGDKMIFWCRDSCLEIVKLILENVDLNEQLKDCLIRSFTKSTSFQDTREKSELLIKFDNFTKEQLDEIIRSSIDNRQIYQSTGITRTFLNNLMEKYNLILGEETIEKLNDLFKS